MKKFLSLVFVLMLAFSSAVMAAGDGNVLTKLQKNSELLVAMFDEEQSTPYAIVSKMLTADTAKNYNEQKYQETKKIVAERFGRIKEEKFFAFQRFDQVDTVTYLVGFTKEPVVNMTFIFDKMGKLTEYQISPMETQENNEKKE